MPRKRGLASVICVFLPVFLAVVVLPFLSRPASACGQGNQACCAGLTCSLGATCNSSNICPSCGAAGQSCCLAGAPCGAGLACSVSQQCVPDGSLAFATAANLPSATVGQAYQNNGTFPQAVIKATGGVTPYAFTVVSGLMAPGLALDLDGSFTGLPSQAANFSFTVQVQDAAGATRQQAFNLAVQPAPPAVCGSTTVAITQISLANARPNSASSQSLSACGGTPPYTFTLVNIRAASCGGLDQPCCGNTTCNSGLACTNGNGQGGNWCVLATQTCGGGGQACCAGSSCDSGFNCYLNGSGGNFCGHCGGPGEACCTSGGACGAGLNCAAGVNGNNCLNAGSQQITGTDQSATAQSGLYLFSNGTISGTATSAPNIYKPSFLVVDSLGYKSNFTGYNLTVAAPLAINNSSLAVGEAGVFYPEQPLSLSGGVAPFFYQCAGGPQLAQAGTFLMACNGNGSFGGATPSVAGSYNILMQATGLASDAVGVNDPNSGPQTATKYPVPLTIYPALVIVSTGLPDGTETIPYGPLTIQTSGGNPANLSVSIATGTLPGGMTATNATLSGTPNAGTAGTYYLNASAYDGLVPNTVVEPLILHILPNGPSFSLAIQPSSRQIVAGSSTTYSVNVSTHNNFNGTVNFNVTGLPSGASYTLPSITGTGTGTLTINTQNNVSTGTFVLTLTGASGSQSYSVQATLIVNSAPDFTVSLPSPISVAVSSSAGYNVSATPMNGFNGTVSFGVSGLPAGVTMSLNPVSLSGSGSSAATLSVSAAANAVPGTYNNVSVLASGNGVSHSYSLTLIVNPADCGSPPFSLALAPQTFWLNAGQSSTFTVSVQPIGGFSGSVPLSLSPPDPGISAGFSPNPVLAGATSQMTLQTAPSTPPNAYSIPVLGQYAGTSGGTCKTSSNLSLTVNGAGGGGGGGVNSGTITFVNSDGVTAGINMSACGGGTLSAARAATSPSDGSFVMAWPDAGLPFYAVVSTGTAGQTGVKGSLSCANALNAPAGNFYSTAQSSGNWTFGVQSGTWSFTQDAVPPAPAKLSISAASNVTQGSCSQGTVQVQNADGTAASLPLPRDVYVRLISTGSDRSSLGFYSDFGCTQAFSSNTFKIPSSANSGTFYFNDPFVETSTITAAGGGLLYARQVLTIAPWRGATNFGVYALDGRDTREPSIASDQYGNLHLAYYDDTCAASPPPCAAGGGLYYVTRPAGGAWSAPYRFAQGIPAGTNVDAFLTNVDPSGVSLAVGVDGSVHVAFFSSNGLFCAKLRGGVLVSSTVVDSGLLDGSFAYSAIALDGAGNPRIAYSASQGTFSVWTTSTTFVGPGGALQYAWFDGASWRTTVLDSAAKISIAGNSNTTAPYEDATNGRQLSMALDAAGAARIAYFDSSAAVLRYGSYDGARWTSEVIPPGPGQAAGDVLTDPSLALDGSGNPHVTYMDDNGSPVLYLAAKSGAFWPAPAAQAQYQTNTPPGTGPIFSTSLALDGFGSPAMAFEISGTNIHWAGFSWQQGGPVNTQVLDPRVLLATGAYSESLALDGSGNPHLAYSDSFDFAPAALQYASAPASAFAFAPPMGGSPGGKAQAPDGFGPAAVSSAAVTWSWTSHSSNDAGYRLFEAAASTGPFALAADTNLIGACHAGPCSYTQTGLSPGTSYFAYVAAVNAGGVVTSSGTQAVTSPAPASSCTGPFPFAFTDNLAARRTVVRAVYANELRSDIDSLRRDAGLSPYSWTDGPTLSPKSSVIRAAYFTELRRALADVYNQCGQALPPYADAAFAPGVTVIKTSAVTDLRAAVLNAK